MWLAVSSRIQRRFQGVGSICDQGAIFPRQINRLDGRVVVACVGVDGHVECHRQNMTRTIGNMVLNIIGNMYVYIYIFTYDALHMIHSVSTFCTTNIGQVWGCPIWICFLPRGFTPGFMPCFKHAVSCPVSWLVSLAGFQRPVSCPVSWWFHARFQGA